MKKTKAMILPMLGLLFTLCLIGCDGEGHESSTDPRLRILGEWKQTLRYGNDVSLDSIFYRFSSDGKIWIKTNEGWEGVEGNKTFGFYDGWTYDEKTDEITGRIYLTYTYYTESGSTETDRTGYRCVIGRKEMRWYGATELVGFLDNRHVFERQ